MKKEEYEALDRIRGILKDFSPEDTYIGKAFEGCVELAEENIRNDWLYSWKGRYKGAQETVEARVKQIAELTRELNQKDDAIARLEDAKNQLSEELEKAKKNEQIAIKGFHKWLNEYRSLNSTFKETWLKLEKAQTEIL
jgi:chromosome segregation ATPase